MCMLSLVVAQQHDQDVPGDASAFRQPDDETHTTQQLWRGHATHIYNEGMVRYKRFRPNGSTKYKSAHANRTLELFRTVRVLTTLLTTTTHLTLPTRKIQSPHVAHTQRRALHIMPYYRIYIYIYMLGLRKSTHIRNLKKVFS